MTRFAPHILVFATGLAAALALVSCGSSSDNLLPGDTAKEILINLDQIKSLNAAGNCSEAESAANQVRRQVTELPSSVDPKLRRALGEGAARLQSVTASCIETTTEITSDTLSIPTEETTQSKESTKQTTRSEPTTDETQATTTTSAPKPPTTTPTGPTTTTTAPPTTGGGSGGVGPGKAKRRG